MRLRYSVEALAHISAIHDYIAEHNPYAAAQVVRRIRAAAERLKEFPHIGHIGLVAGTMEWTVRGLPYVIVHEVDPDAGEIIVLGVYHGAQQRAH
jgi:plasmid stabilization system protein ParE